MRRARIGAAAASMVVAACAQPTSEHARDQWLWHTLVLDNQVFLEREPELAGGKLAKMSDGPYRFFRGTAAQYARDVMEPGSPGYWPTAFGSEQTRDVALVGDPHPENIGTFRRADGTMVVDFNDFDGATFGPYDFDLRRLALGFWVAAEQIDRDHAALVAMGEPVEQPLREGDREALARAVVTGYVDEIARAASEPGPGLVLSDAEAAGVVLGTLLEGAIEDGDAQEKLEDYTRVEDGVRRMIYGDVEAPRTLELGREPQVIYEDTMRRLGARERTLVTELLARYADSRDGIDPQALRLKGSARRLGAGVSSYPVARYYLLVEGDSEAVEDDVLLELKQVLDPVPMPGLLRYPSRPFSTNAERVVGMQRALQAFDDDDPWLGWAVVGDDGYRVRWRSGYQRGVQVPDLSRDLADDDLVPDDLVVFAELAGRLLARSHGRAPKGDGTPAAPAIAAAIGDDGQGLVEEVMAFVDAYAPRVLADHAAFVELLEAHGPRLGYRRR